MLVPYFFDKQGFAFLVACPPFVLPGRPTPRRPYSITGTRDARCHLPAATLIRRSRRLRPFVRRAAAKASV